MGDKFTKLILVGILLSLIVIANKPNNIQVMSASPVVPSSPNIEVNEGEQVIQIAPNRIGIIDNRIVSDTRGTVLVFDYDINTKKFNYAGTMNYLGFLKYPSVFEEPKK